MMEVIGFVALIVFGLCAVVIGALGLFASIGLSGRAHMTGEQLVMAIVVVVGAAVLVFAGMNSPFAVTLKG